MIQNSRIENNHRPHFRANPVCLPYLFPMSK
jgi:hypothetical protein